MPSKGAYELYSLLVGLGKCPGGGCLSSHSRHHGRVAPLDPDQLAALRRLRATFGFVLILEVRELQPCRDPAPAQAPPLVDEDQAPEPEPPDRR
jgi:hypothetical protein